MSFNMFYTGLSGLNASQAALMTTGHNTANVNTKGYSRQSAEIASSGGTYAGGIGFFGTGAKVSGITRSYDQFLTTQLNTAQSSTEALTTQYAQVSQIDDLLANQAAGLAPLMQSFFAGVQTVAGNPADPAARQQLIGSGEAMTNQFRVMSLYLEGLNSNVNEQISGSVDLINAYAEQIASLNKQISLVGNASGGQAPNDLLDQRDQLVADLSKLVGTKVVVQAGGQYSVFMGNGQTLVLGDKAANLQAVVSDADPSQKAVAMTSVSGTALQLQDSVFAGGSLGGLLQFRNETLTNAQNSLGRIAIAMSDSFNAQQKLGVDLNGLLGTEFFSQAIPSVVANDLNDGDLVFTAKFADTGELTNSDYRLSVLAGGTYSLIRLSDSHAIDLTGFPSTAVTFDGLTLSLGSGSAQQGDSFLIQPTRAGARDFAVVMSDPGKLAAASAIVVGNTFGNRGSGAISGGTIDTTYTVNPPVKLTYDSLTSKFSSSPASAAITVRLANAAPSDAGITYLAGTPVPYTPGATLSFSGITVIISGEPADGDTFTIAHNTGGVSDGSNALLLAKLQSKKTIGSNASSFNDAYAQLVSTVGNKARQVQISNTAQTSLTAQIRTAQQSVSGVNQDEETANLLMYQQMYQANAKVIQTASTMFDAILGIHG